MHRRTTTLLSSLLVVATLAACSGADTGAADDASSEAGTVAVTASTAAGDSAVSDADDSEDAAVAATADEATASQQVITDIQAAGSGPGAPFDGTVDTAADLDALVETAWGEGSLGLHRGHAPIEEVLVAFLGISHEEMHVYMEQQGMNLEAVTETLGGDPEDLVDTLTASFVPFIEEGVENGVISEDEVATWTDAVRSAFSERVSWTG